MPPPMISLSTLPTRLPEQVELGRNLGAAHDRADRLRLGAPSALFEALELGLHQAARRGRQAVGEPLGRGVSSMRRRKGVVDVDVAQGRELVDEACLVLLFFLVEAEVLEQQHVAVLERTHGILGGDADAVVGEGDGLADRLGKRLDQRLQRHPRHALAIGPAEVAEHDHPGPLVGEFLQGRRGALDAHRIAHLAVLHRHVEVDPHEDALAGHGEAVDGLEAGFRHGSATTVSE